MKKISLILAAAILSVSMVFTAFAETDEIETIIFDDFEEIVELDEVPDTEEIIEITSDETIGDELNCEEIIYEETTYEETTYEDASDEIDEFEEENVELLEAKYGNLTWSFNRTSGVLTISGKGEMSDMDNASSTTAWLAYRNNIKGVIIGNGITSIGAYAFYGCGYLKSINIPNSVVTIGDYAFANTGLTRFKLPDSIFKIGNGILIGNTDISEITVPATLKYGQRAFVQTSIKTITFADGITVIPEEICQYAESIEKVIMPNTVTEIKKSAFEGCKALTDITLSLTLEKIGDMAFKSTSSLKSIDFPSSLVSFGRYVFEASGLESFSFPPYLQTVGAGLLYSNKKIKEVTIPASMSSSFVRADMTEYGGVFTNSAVETVIIEHGSTAIFYGMFYVASNLKTVHIPNTVKLVEGTTFYKANALTDIYYWGTQSYKEKKLKISSTNNECLLNATWHYSDMYKDISSLSSSFRNAINWMGENGFASTSSEFFNPSNPCTRIQTIVFLYRIFGKPDVKGSVSFPDCQKYGKNSDSYKAILWATNKGIVKGYSNGNFGPDDTVTRKQVMIILYRAAGKPTAEGKTGFTDVDGKFSTTSDTYKAILWGTKKGITKGYSDGRFGIDDKCLRRQIALFLFRQYGGK